ncbi:23861_t:CDS:2, partial [Gigaspora rosea]
MSDYMFDSDAHDAHFLDYEKSHRGEESHMDYEESHRDEESHRGEKSHRDHRLDKYIISVLFLKNT